MSDTKYLADLSLGEVATLVGFENMKIASKLLAMGTLPGSKLEVVRKAPLGGAIYVQLQGSLIALRRSEAAEILVK